MELQIAIGTRTEPVSIPDRNLLGILDANAVEAGPGGVEAVAEALAHPIGAPLLEQVVHPGETVAIITSDITRPMPTALVLPLVPEALGRGGIRDEDITLVFGLGSHRRQTEEERRRLAGDAYGRIRCVDSDPNDCVHLGTTRRGTPVDVTRVVAEADRIVCLGNIEYHYFVGYSGGVKAVMPGVSSRDAIQANHSRMVLPEAHAGKLEGNPIREDVEEAGRLAGVDYIVNVVLGDHKEILFAVAGHPVEAHRVGCRFLDTLYRKPIPQRADIVLTSQGGAPKDLNLYQTQKALDNAKHAVRPGGTIILVGSCREGLGEGVFEQWIREARRPEDLIERVQAHFQLGGHKAAAIAMVLQEAEVYLVSEMDPAMVERVFLRPFGTVQEALDAAMAKHGPDATVLVMPHGGSTLPLPPD